MGGNKKNAQLGLYMNQILSKICLNIIYAQYVYKYGRNVTYNFTVANHRL